MLIRSHLFDKGPWRRQPGLSDVLDHHKRSILHRISAISDIDQMTDAFLDTLVKDSLVEPLCFDFGGMTRRLRTEEFDGSELPFDFCAERGHRYPKTVARIS